MKDNRIALIPAYNPKEEITKIIKELKQENFKVIVVNDGSSENYQGIFNQIGAYVTLLNHSKNMGKGQAIKTGLKYIKENEASNSIIALMDCDTKHTIIDIQRVCNEAEVNINTFIVGTRAKNNAAPIRNRVENAVTKTVLEFATKEGLSNTQTDLRAFGYSLIDFLVSINGSKFEYDMNVLLSCAKYNVRMKEIEFESLEEKNIENPFSLPIKDTVNNYKDLLGAANIPVVFYVIDYVLFFCLMFVSGHILVSNIFARIISSLLYFNQKRGHYNDLGASAFQYMIVTIALLVIDTFLLYLFADIFHLNAYIAKIFTAILYALFKYGVDTYFIKEEKN